MNGLNGTFTPDVPHGGYRRLVKGGQTHDYHDQHGAVGSDTEFQILSSTVYESMEDGNGISGGRGKGRGVSPSSLPPSSIKQRVRFTLFVNFPNRLQRLLRIGTPVSLYLYILKNYALQFIYSRSMTYIRRIA